MERAEWLKKIRAQTEELYDHLAPLYWLSFGLYSNATHRQFIDMFLGRLSAQSSILDAACGAGRYDGLLLEAGHAVLGIDQSDPMLVRAREQFPQERFPRLHYFRLGLQEIDFHAQFDGAICIDAMEHVFPEDWPDILARFHKALKPGGVLYITVEQADSDEVRQVCDRAKALGLPVVFGELADKIDAAHAQVIALDWHEISGELAGPAAYHYYPSPEQVRTWLDQLGFAIEEEGAADEYLHILARKKV